MSLKIDFTSIIMVFHFFGTSGNNVLCSRLYAAAYSSEVHEDNIGYFFFHFIEDQSRFEGDA